MQRSPARKAEEGENSTGGHGQEQAREGATNQFPSRIRALTLSLPLVRTLAVLSTLLPLAAGGSVGFANLLRVGEPISVADQRLQANGWRPAPQRQPDQLDQQRAGNRLVSLSGCSGAGLGYCRYDYRREPHSLSVITASNLAGLGLGARVVRWSEDPGGRQWGLCQPERSAELVPCQGP